MIGILRHRVVTAAMVAIAAISAFALLRTQQPASTVLESESVLSARLDSYPAAVAAHHPIDVVTDRSVAAREPRRDRQRFGERKPRFDSPGEAALFRYSRHVDETGQVPDGALMRAKAQADALRAAQPFRPNAGGISNSSWTFLGPGNIGGRIRAVAVHPTTTSTIFIGSVSGGIWKTTNSGSSWSVVNDFMANLAVTSIVFQPGTPATMYAGTGEGFYNSDSIRGAGIFKSIDSGVTWTQLTSTANASFYYVNRLALSADGTTILAATRSGLWRSLDAGVSWSLATGTGTSDIYDVKFLPGSSVNAVASRSFRRVYHSSNGGSSWTQTASLTTSTPNLRPEIGVSVSSPSTVYLSVDTGGDTGEIWKSTNSGVTYTMMATPSYFGAPGCSSCAQGWYDNVVWVDPTNADRVVVGGTLLSRSTDGGTTWSNLSYGNHLHPDQHAIVHDPGYNGGTNKRVYIGNDGGMYLTNDIFAASASASFTALNNNLGITQFYGAAGNATSGKIFGGTQDNGSLLYTPSTGAIWSDRAGGDGGFAAADPTDVNILYGEYQNMGLHRNTSGGTGFSHLINGDTGTSCKPAPFVITDACNSTGVTALFIAPFILDPNNVNRLLAGGASLWRTNDAKTPNASTTGPTWAAIKVPDTSATANYISAIAVAPGNSDIVWVGHRSQGAIYKATNGTAATPTWVNKRISSMPTRFVGRIAIHPTSNDTVYVAYTGFNSDNLWKTTDGGSTWASASGTGGTALPAAPIYGIAIHPNVANWVYVGTEVGVFASTDGGATWSLPQDGPANVSVDELFWMGASLVAVTHGRGIFTSPAAATVPGAPTGVTGVSGNGQVSVSFNAPSDNGGVPITGYTATASPGGATATGSSSPIVVTGLTNGTAYTFTVTATNSVGTSAASSASSAVTPATVPGAPTGVSGSAGNGQVTVSFTAPSSNGGAAITSYTVTASPGGATATGTNSPITVTGLTNGTAYTFTVTATNSAGTSAASSASSPVTPTTTPGAPTGVTAFAGNAQATVSFTAPSSNGGSAITGYTVTASPGGATATSSVGPIVVTGLTNGTAYTFTATATNSAGTGPASSASTAVTPSASFGQQFPATLTGGQQVPAVSTTGTGAGVVVLNAAETQITVSMSFSGLSSAANAAHIHGAAAIGANAGVLFDFSGVTPAATSGSVSSQNFAITAAQVTDLKAGLYYFNIHTANNGGGEIRGQIGVTPPGAPTAVTGTRGNGQVSVAFTAPASNGGSAITGYTVTASPGGATAAGTSSPIVVTGLTNGTAYTFTVTATNIIGTGPASSASSAVTPATVPGAPTGVAGTPASGQVSVAFTAPTSDGGSAITGYTVTASPGGATGTGTSSPIVVSGLTNGTAYTFTVTATNSIGTGAASSASSAVTPGLVPGAPTNVIGVAGNAQVSVSFTAPSSNGGVAITGYTVTASPGGATATGSSSPIVVTGLTNGTAYTFTVRATNAVGTGPASAASAAVTPSLPTMSRTPSTLAFGATNNSGVLSNITAAQTVTVTFVAAAPTWTATTTTPWLQITGGSGTGNGQFTVAVISAAGLPATGTTSGSVTITSGGVTNSPLTVTVNLTLFAASVSGSPFGSFDTPINGATGLSGAIPVSGWALDDIEVTRVEIWRDRVAGETTPVFTGAGPGNGKIYIADPLFVSGARSDVEAANPTLPFAYRAGWGYLMLTQGLWNQGTGTYTLYAFAYDRDGHVTVLGSKTITSNNATAVKPFGSIDTPTYGQTVTGSFWNFGWALTPNATPTCTIVNGQVFMAVDSGTLIPVSYGGNRTDIAAAFPGFSNGAAAGGAFFLDTTTLSNGVHQIGWFVVDNCNRSEGIGSRFFTVLNGSSTVPIDEAAPPSIEVMPSAEPVVVRRMSSAQELVEPSPQADRVITVAQGERIEVQLPSNAEPYRGAQVVNGERRALPLGSSLDASHGVFYWEPAAGFLGAQDLEFTAGDQGPVWVRVIVGTSVQTVIDTPRAGDVSSSFVIAGWAIDQAARVGTGIDTVHVWAYPATGAEPIFLGVANYGDVRADVGATLGEQFAASSYNLSVDGTLAAGEYQIVVYPRSAVTGDFRGAQVVRVTVR